MSQKDTGKRKAGLLAESSAVTRRITAAVLAVVCVSLTFTQLGFLGIGMPGEYTAYAIVLLLPVALAALLLGTLTGLLMGVFAGAVLLAHATLLPLDFYELSFVTPLTSVGMLGVAGILLGLLFKFVLRNDPPRVRRVIYIVIVCVVVSWLYSIGFVFNVLSQVAVASVMNVTESTADAVANQMFQEHLRATVLRMGDNVDMQAWCDAALMALFCVAADFVSSKAGSFVGRIGVRSMFAVRLAVVVFVAFMLTSAATFASITQSAINAAADDMDDEVSYLCAQLEYFDARMSSMRDIFEGSGVSVEGLSGEDVNKLADYASVGTLLDGYSTERDGTVLVLTGFSSAAQEAAAAVAEGAPEAVMYDPETYADPSTWDDLLVISSDSELFSGPSSKVSEAAGLDFVEIIKASIISGHAERFVFDRDYGISLDDEALYNDSRAINSEIAYLLARQSGDYVVAVMYPASKVFAGRADVMGWATLSTFVLLVVVFGMTFWLLSSRIVRRIDDTNEVLGRITGGDLDACVDVRDTREFASLSDGINETVGALKGWIAEAETRMDAELATAKAIQESALPQVFPPFPAIMKFDIYANMQAAREVGGDFYDFFLIDDADVEAGADAGKLGFVMADVSGKGVPAALFMMKAKTQLRDYLESGMAIGEAVENANRQLCEGNDAGMFVTAWVGVLDYASGTIEFVNAGHNPPLLWQRETGWRWVTEKSGMPLGLFDGFPYQSYSLECVIGDELLLYTDGVTEAMSVDGELYGEDRLERLANKSFALHPRLLVDAVRYDVARWAQGAEQSDDITILALEVGVPPEITATLEVPADVDELPRVNHFIHTELDRRLCPLRVQHQLDIAVEELFVNVAHYAYPDATPDNPGLVHVSYCYFAEPSSIQVQIIDGGVPFDPLAKPDAVTPDDIMDVPIGGLGILMAKRSVDEITYERLGESNVITITKAW